MYYDILPETLITLRNLMGWSQEKLASEAGMHRKTIIEKERGVGPVKTREFIAIPLAAALAVDVTDLGKPIPEATFVLDVDVFAHLQRSLKSNDDYHTKRLLDYVTYHLAEALEAAEIELAPDWQRTVLDGPRPRLPSMPKGPVALSYGPTDEKAFGNLLAVWHHTFGDAPINPDTVLRASEYGEFHEAVRGLPVVEDGRINHFWFKAYLRRNASTEAGEFALFKLPHLHAELWYVEASE